MRTVLFDDSGQAECLRLDPKYFYPQETDWVPPAARLACAICPVKCPCFEWAIVAEEYGVWAGLSEQQRWDIRDQISRGEISLGQAVALQGCVPDPDDL